MPFAIVRKYALSERKFVQRDSGALDLDLRRVAAEIGESAPQRFWPNDNQCYGVEHVQGRFSISWLIHVDHNISAVEGNNRRALPPPNQWQEMHSDVSKVNMQKARPGVA